MLKVWILNHHAITPNLPGGTRHYDFAKELINRGCDTTIFASSFHHILSKEIKDYKGKDFVLEDFDGVKFVWLKTFPYSNNDWKRIINMLSYSVRAYKVAKSLKIERPDVVIGSSVHLFAAYTAYLLSKCFKVPFIMEVRDLWPQTLIDMGTPKWHPFVLLLRMLEKYLYRRANRIVTLLPKADGYIKSLGISANKIVWIPNGTNLKRFAENCLNHQKESHGTASKFVVVYMGAMGKANNLGIAIEASEVLQRDYPDIRFLFVGDGPEKTRLMRMARECNIKNVEFRTPVSKEVAASILLHADVLYFNLKNSPIFKYGISSNKLFDYLAAGRPIIFASGSINNPVNEASSGITVSPDSPQELVDAIIALYRMPEGKRREMGLNGRKYVEKHHSLQILVDKLEVVIKEVMSAKEADYASI